MEKVRNDFKILHQKVNQKPLVYLDNAATTQKPDCVINTICNYYNEINSNIHRGVHTLSQLATTAFENVREDIKNFINAKESAEIIFTKGTTEAINLVADCFSRAFIKKGDSVVVIISEHHSNFVPWQAFCKKIGAKFVVVGLDETGQVDMQELKAALEKRPKLLAINHASNVLGTINPIKEIIDLAHQNGTYVLVDGAQSIAHTKIDVRDLDCDFFCFSAHKMYAPMGVGVLFGKREILEAMPPYQFGGEMIKEVSIENTTFNELPFKFEAGTPNVEGVLALGTAIKYMQNIGIDNIIKHDTELLTYTIPQLLEIPKMKIYGQHNLSNNTYNNVGVISFNIGNIHSYDVGVILDHLGVAVRTGHHCAQALMSYLNITGTTRCSFAIYNNKEDVDIFISALKQAYKMLN